MKYTNLEGLIFEGTPEEIARLRAIEGSSKVRVIVDSSSDVEVEPVRGKAIFGSKHWTREEDNIVRQLYSHLSAKEVSKHLPRKRTPHAITQRACHLGVKKLVREKKVVRIPRLLVSKENDVAFSSFPVFDSVPVQYARILEDAVRNVVKNKGSLSYSKDGFAFGLESFGQWRVFCQEFIVKASRVAGSIGVKNGFKVVGFSVTYQ
jgi:hypothetical protein